MAKVDIATGLSYNDETKVLEVTNAFVGMTSAKADKNILDISRLSEFDAADESDSENSSSFGNIEITTIKASDRTTAITIKNVGSNTSVIGGSGADNISVAEEAEGVYIDGGAGADKITISGGNNTILASGANGADAIVGFSSGDIIQLPSDGDATKFSAGTGTYTAKSKTAKVTLTLGTATLNSKNNPATTTSKVTLTQTGVDTLPQVTIVNSKGKAVVSQTFGATTADSTNASVVSGALDVTSNASVVTLDGASFTEDSTTNLSLTGNTIANVLVGGKGKNTLSGGTGNDTYLGSASSDEEITIGKSTLTYAGGAGSTIAYSGGKDVVLQFDPSKDVLDFSSTGNTATYAISGNDVVFTLSKNNTLTLKNGRNKQVTYYDGSGSHKYYLRATTDYIINDSTVKSGKDTTTLSGGAKQIVASDTTLTLIDASTSEWTGSTPLYIQGGAKATTIKASANADTLYGAAGNDVLVGNSSLLDDSEDSTVEAVAAITYAIGVSEGNNTIVDYKAGDIVKFLSSDVKVSKAAFAAKTGDLVLTLANTTYSTKANGSVTSKVTNSTLTFKGIGTLLETNDERYVKNKTLYVIDTPITITDGNNVTTTQIYGGTDLTIAESDGASIDTTGNSTVKNISFSEDDTIPTYVMGNALANSITAAENGNTTISGGAGNDTLVANDAESEAPTTFYITDTGKNVIENYVPDRDAIVFANGISITKAAVSGLTVTGDVETESGVASTNTGVEATGDVVLTLSNKGTLTIKGAVLTATVVTTNKGKSTNTAETTKKLTINNTSGELLYKQAFGGTEITIADGDGTTIDATGNTNVKTVNGSSRTSGFAFVGNTAANTVIGGAGGDTITGSTGADYFIYDGRGSDYIADYSATQKDVIQFQNAYITSSDEDNGNLIFHTKTSDGSEGGDLTIIKGTEQKITIIDKDGNSSTHTYSGTKTWTIDNNDSATVSAADDSLIKTVDASKRTKAITLVGNNNANGNSLVGGTANDVLIGNGGTNNLEGGKGNDTIYGGSGANTMTGGAGNDVFVFQKGDGNLVITDFTTGTNKIRLEDGIYIASATLSGADSDTKKNVVLNLSETNRAITIVGAEGTKIPIDFVSTDSVVSSSSQIYGSSEVTVANTDGAEIDTNTDDPTVVVLSAAKRTTAVNLIGNTLGNTIVGGSGADTINPLSGNDYVTGGKGADVFIYSGGDDTISDYNYSSQKDLIVLGTGVSLNNDVFVRDDDGVSRAEGLENAYEISGNNIILKTTAGDLTIVNGKGASIAFWDGETTEEVTSGKKTVTQNVLSSVYSGLYDDYTTKTFTAKEVVSSEDVEGNVTIGTYTADNLIKTIDASARAANTKNPLNIVGTDNGLTIKGSKGADTITGGTGDDVITTGAGNDTVFYTGGEDTITDYTAGGDVIVLTGDYTNVLEAKTEGADITFTFMDNNGMEIEGNSLTIQNAINTDKKGNTTTGKKITFAIPETSGSDDEEEEETEVTYRTYTQIYGGSDEATLTIANDDGATIDASAKYNANKVTTLNAKSRSSEVVLVGSSLTSTLTGGSKADTIIANREAATITGNGGNDYFDLSNVKNAYIADYTAGDAINLGDEVVVTSIATVTSGSGKTATKDLLLTTSNDDGVITLKGGVGKVVSIGSYVEADTEEDSEDTEEEVGMVFSGTALQYAAGAATYSIAVGDVSLEAYNAKSKTNTFSAVAADDETVKAGSSAFSTLTVDGSKIGTGVLTITGNSANSIANVIKGGTVGNNITVTNTANNSIVGGAGNDSIVVGNGNNTVTTGAGVDYIDYGARGTLTITDYTAAATAKSGDDGASVKSGDVIHLGAAQFVKSSKLEGKDVVLTIGSSTKLAEALTDEEAEIGDSNATLAASTSIGSITLTNATGKKISIVENASSEGVSDDDNVAAVANAKVYGATALDAAAVTEEDEEGNKTTYYEADATAPQYTNVSSITAAAATKAKVGATIKTNTNNTTVTGSSYADVVTLGTGSNTITLGKGNDTIYGNSSSSGTSVINYAVGDGDDVIVDYNANDFIKVTTVGAQFTYDISDDESDIILSIANSKGASLGTITLKDVGSKTVLANVQKTKTSSDMYNLTIAGIKSEKESAASGYVASEVETPWFAQESEDSFVTADSADVSSIVTKDADSAAVAVDYSADLTSITNDADLTQITTSAKKNDQE